MGDDRRLFDLARPVIAPFVSAVIAAVLTALARHGLEVKLDETARGTLNDVAIGFLLGLYGLINAAIHKAIAARVNPTDAASPSLAKAAATPFGTDARTNLANAMQQQAATGEMATQTAPNVPVVTPEQKQAAIAAVEEVLRPTNPTIGPSGITSRPADFRPPAFEPLVDKAPLATRWPEPPEDEEPPVVAPAPRTRERRKRAPKVTIQEPGAPQPTTPERAESPEGFEP